MGTPSSTLLDWLRSLIAERGTTTAAVAAKAGIPRSELRKALTGKAPMTVDQLLLVSQALDLKPADMGVPDLDGVDEPEPEPEEPAEPEEPTLNLDPFGNHPAQLFKVGFELGCDFFFLVRSEALLESGVPKAVIKQYEGRDLPIKLDAAYHAYNEPKFSKTEISLTLSFDKLYDCTFPWHAVHRVVFFPAEEEPPEVDPPEPEPKSDGRPHLRLVT